MASPKVPSAALLRSLRALTCEAPSAVRSYSSTRTLQQEAQATAKPALDPETVATYREEWELTKAGTPPIGSRRRRLALQQTSNIPFDALPYQCFQEARQILIQDRAEKLKQIETERGRIQRLRDTDASQINGGEIHKARRLKSMEEHLDKLKIYADINDPNVKRRFEDGKGMSTGTRSSRKLTSAGDLNKPIYRFLADRKWREYRRKIQVQRIETMKVVPDVVPTCELEVDIRMYFGRKQVAPGDFVDSAVSENLMQLTIQSFARGERLISIAVINPDVPNIETDLFDSRCHFLATNIPITPTTPLVDLSKLSESQVIFPWLPPYAQKGSPYHRMSVVVLEHENNVPLEKEAIANMFNRKTFHIRHALTRYPVKPIGAALFRTKWDDNMADVMTRNGFEGANIELKRRKVEPLPYKRRNPSSFR
jgi:large subunit ribosomal protein L35